MIRWNRGAIHVLLGLIVLVVTRSASAATIQGQVVLPEEAVRSGCYATLFWSGAGNTHRRRKAFLEAATDSFRFDDVGDGVYSLDVEAPPYVFSAVKVTVENGVVKEALASEVGNVPLPVDQGLRMVPLRALQYFEQRGKFSLWAFVKTPYGAMIFFALFSVIVMPYLKVDPEEYRQMKRELAQMRGDGKAAIDDGGRRKQS